jgi:hypothetical protein
MAGVHGADGCLLFASRLVALLSGVEPPLGSEYLVQGTDSQNQSNLRAAVKGAVQALLDDAVEAGDGATERHLESYMKDLNGEHFLDEQLLEVIIPLLCPGVQVWL